MNRQMLMGVMLLLGFGSILWAEEPVGSQNGKTVNLIKNSSFEILESGMAEGWGTGGQYREQISVDNEIAYHGNRSIHFLLNGAAGNETRFSGGGILPFEVGKTYTVSAFVKTKHLEPANGLRICLITESWTADTKPITPESATSDWKRYSLTFTVGRTKTGNWRMVVLPDEGTKGEVWIDAVQVEEGSQATDYQPTE